MYRVSNKSCLHMEIQNLPGWMIFQKLFSPIFYLCKQHECALEEGKRNPAISIQNSGWKGLLKVTWPEPPFSDQICCEGNIQAEPKIQCAHEPSYALFGLAHCQVSGMPVMNGDAWYVEACKQPHSSYTQGYVKDTREHSYDLELLSSAFLYIFLTLNKNKCSIKVSLPGNHF